MRSFTEEEIENISKRLLFICKQIAENKNKQMHHEVYNKLKESVVSGNIKPIIGE